MESKANYSQVHVYGREQTFRPFGPLQCSQYKLRTKNTWLELSPLQDLKYVEK